MVCGSLVIRVASATCTSCDNTAHVTYDTIRLTGLSPPPPHSSLMDYLETHKIWVPGRHFSPVPLSQKWTQYIATQDRCDTGSGAPTEYSYVTTLGSNIRRPRSFPPSTGKKHGPRNSRNQVMRIGFDTEPALQTRLPDPEPELQPPTPIDMRTHRQSIKFIESRLKDLECAIPSEPPLAPSAISQPARCLLTPS